MSKKQFSLTPGAPLPKSIGRCADFYKEVMELRLWMEKQIAPYKKREGEIRDHIIENLSKSDDTGASGLKYKALIVEEEQPTVKDWEKVYDYIAENDRFDLLNKNINAKAIKEMWGNNKKVPGIETINVKKVSITKI